MSKCNKKGEGYLYLAYFIDFQGELVSIYSSLRYVSKSGLYSVSMPNAVNFSFDFHLFLIIVMLSYIPSKFQMSLLSVQRQTGFPSETSADVMFSNDIWRTRT